MIDMLQKDETMVLKMLRELKENVENRKNTNKEKTRRNQIEIVQLKHTVTKMKNSVVSKADVSRQSKKSANLKMEQWKLLSLRNGRRTD